MRVKTKGTALNDIKQSKFVRSVFLRTVFIFIFVIIAITVIAFFSFTSEINDRIVSERQKQLDVIKDTISSRMKEVSSISYSLGKDNKFYLEPVEDDVNSGYEMSSTLERFLAGNDFIEHLAYYRLSEPDTIYVSSGKRSLSEFWHIYLGLDEAVANGYTEQIQKATAVSVVALPSEEDGCSYFAYVCPLPLLSKNPKAFVLMLIPFSEIKPVLESQLINCYGEIMVLDASGNELCRLSNLGEDLPADAFTQRGEEYYSYGGDRFVVQRAVSDTNGWTYVSAIRLSDMISQTASRQILFIALMMILMVAAIFAMIFGIIKQYKPISDLAMTLADKSGEHTAVIDEKSVLSDTFATLRDDSEQKQMFETAYIEATAANKAKSAFLSNMSHDIRTPMNAIVGMTEIAIKNLDDPHYVKACLQKVRVASQYLLDIINNVLDMSRIESGKFTLSEDVVELPKLVRNVITILNQNLGVKSQKLIVKIENICAENVMGDSVRLTQVFMNILSNSAKFTPNGGTISLTVRQNDCDKDGYGDYVFVFSDTGIGMSSEFTKKVFETFSRDEKSISSKVEGTGLGMAIAKSFVELMGGTIKCESELGKGTTFTINMRMKLADSQPDTSYTKKHSGMSVLLVGGDETTSQNQTSLFEQFGVKTDYAHDNSSAAALVNKSLAENTPYSFVVINQSDKDVSGVGAVTEISNGIKSEDTSYILLAQDILSVERSYAFDSGIDTFVQMPLFASTVRDILDKTIKARDNNNIDYAPLDGLRILLVEDNEINRLVARDQISSTNAEVVDATDGKEAVEAFKSHEPGYFDIILMDVQMPVMNGYEATSAIRSIQRRDAKTIPIYAMTANTFDEDVRQVREAGMNGHLGKPYTFDELYRILEKVANK